MRQEHVVSRVYMPSRKIYHLPACDAADGFRAFRRGTLGGT